MKTLSIIVSTALLATVVLGQTAAVNDALAAARALPDGPQKDAILKALNASSAPPTKSVSYLDELRVDSDGKWNAAELKKSQVAQMLGAAEEVLLKDGRRVKLSSVTSLTPSGLRWIGEGIEEAHWSLLPEASIAAYGFTPARQSSYEVWRKEQDVLAGRMVAEKNRAVLAEAKADLAAKESSEKAMANVMANRVAVSLRVSQATAKGCLCYGKRIETSSVWGRWEGLRWVPGLEVAEEHDSPIFVVGLPEDTVDGAKMAGWLYPCGIYRYITVMGGEKTVRKYAASPDRAISEMNQR